MATVQKYLPWNTGTQADFDALVEGMHDALVSTFGWVQVTQTGEAATNPAVPSSAYVFRCYRPADALQTGATQYFLKLEWGFSATALRVRFQLGEGLNGSGTLTGNTSDLLTIPSADIANLTAALGYECNFSGDTGRACFMMFRNVAIGTNYPWVVCIERTRATDGTPSTTGVSILRIAHNSLRDMQTLVFGVGAPTRTTPCALAAFSTAATSAAYNNQVAVSPFFPWVGKFDNPQGFAILLKSLDTVEGCIYETTLYGATMHFLASALGNMIAAGPNAGSNYGVGIRWD